MPPYTRRRPRETDPAVAARLHAITYSDPYVFVHANDVLEPEIPAHEVFPVEELVGGWVPDPPRPPADPVRPAPPPVRSVRLELLRQRLEPARSGVAALLVLGVIAAAIAGVMLLRAQPSATSSALPVRASGAAAAVAIATPGETSAPTTLWVDVTGKVHRPGVVKLRSGARVIDAVRAAGGALPGTSMDSLNLAAKLTDGQQVAVGAAAAAQAPAGGDAPVAAAPVDLNTATVEQLQTLPGIGPVLAQRIIDYRTAHGPFTSVDGLQQVGGIGPSKFSQLKDHVTA